MKEWKNFLLVVIGVLSITTINAYQNDCYDSSPPPVCECPEPVPCCEIPGGPTTSAFNHPANINVCGAWDMFATGTFLWVLPSMEQMEFAVTSYGGSHGGIGIILHNFIVPSDLESFEVGTIHDFNFDWKPAFKVGLGCNFDHDNWDIYLQYTRINTSMSNSVSHGNKIGEYLSNLILNQPYGDISKIKSKWDLDFNTFDLEFGRPYYNGKYLQFKAHYGLKGGWINHTNDLESIIDTTIYKGTTNSKSWLIGPRAGIYTKWTFDDGFRFFGNAAASLFYQKFYKISHKEPSISNPKQFFIALNSTDKPINASFESMLGLGWGTYFDRNNWYFDLSIGYEAQLFLNQNKMVTVTQISNNNARVKAGNLMFHGLNLTMEFDF